MTETATEVCWILTTPDGEDPSLPEWKRMAGIREDGAILLPATVWGDELEVFAAAQRAGYGVTLHDGYGVTLHDGHYYVPTSWAASQFPEDVEWLHWVERAVRRLATEPLVPDIGDQ